MTALHTMNDGAEIEGDMAVLDALGLMCPEPLRLAAEKLGAMGAGDCLQVLSDDPASPIDFEIWCLRRGHELLGRENQAAGHWRIILRKGNTQA